MHVFNYNIKIDDLIELGLYRLQSNPQVQLQTRVLNLVVPIVIFLGSIGTVYVLDADKQLTPIDWIVPCVLVVFMLFLFPRTFTSNLRKRIAAQLNEGPEKDMLGKYTAKVMPELIVQTFKGREIRAAWTAVSRVGSTDQHIFILVDESQGIVIPRAGLASAEEFEQARKLILEYRRSKS